MLWKWALTTSLGFPYFPSNILFALLYPAEVKGNPSIMLLTFGSRSSFKYDNFITEANLELSVSTLNRFQNLVQSKWVPLNLVISNCGNFTLTSLSLLVGDAPNNFTDLLLVSLLLLLALLQFFSSVWYFLSQLHRVYFSQFLCVLLLQLLERILPWPVQNYFKFALHFISPRFHFFSWFFVLQHLLLNISL